MSFDSPRSCLFLTNDAGINTLTLSADRRSIWYETTRGWWSVDTNGKNNHALEAGDTGNSLLYANSARRMVNGYSMIRWKTA